MVSLKALSTAAALITVSNAQLFPIVTKTVPDSLISKGTEDISAYVTSCEAQPAWTAALEAIQTDAPDVYLAYGGPLDLANSLLYADATPDWFSELPTQAQQYVLSAASAEASIFQRDYSGANVERPLWVGGVVMVAMAVGVILL